jgi:hypothetical protein
MTTTRFFHRSGKPASRREVTRARQNAAEAKRTGRCGPLACSIQPTVADRIDRMTDEEFATWSGQFTYRSGNR